MKTILLVVFFMAAATSMEPPSIFKICKRSQPKYFDCIVDAVKYAIAAMAKNGAESFDILPLEPLAVNDIKIGESKGSISLKQEYKNIKLYGLTKGLEAKYYNIDWDTLLFNSSWISPQIDFIGDYNFDGKILLLPIKSSGKSNITMYNVISHCVVYCEKFEKEGETYLRAKKFILKLETDKVNLQFDNLFGSNNAVGEPLNKLFNEQGNSIFKELKGTYEDTFSKLFKKMTNNIFTRIPMNKLFPLN